MTANVDTRTSATALQRAAERLSAAKTPGCFVEIGAMDGRTGITRSSRSDRQIELPAGS